MRTTIRPLTRVLIAAAAALASCTLFGQGTPEEIRIRLGSSIVIDYPEDVARISTSNPEVVDYVPVSTREILLHGKGVGTATLVVWAKSGQRNFYNMTVDPNLEPYRKLIRDAFPNEKIQLQGARDSVTLTGVVSSTGVAERAVALIAPAAKTVVNNLQVSAPAVEKQIMLRVKFAELNRNAANSLGVNIVSTGAGNTPGRVTTGQFSAPSIRELRGVIPGGNEGTLSEYIVSEMLNVFAFRPDLNLAAFIRALQQNGLLQIIAEPNLVTSNGKEASFLVGGEFPVPVLQGGSNAGAVTIQFREFGIRLTFNPQITGHGTLKMFVKPEVSTIDIANAVTVSGFTIPALSTRRIESTIELGMGQSFIIGGLIDDRTTENFYKIPGLSSIPILGNLFKSRQETRAKTELIVMVTPELVDPLNPTDPKVIADPPKALLPPAMFHDASAAGAKKGTANQPPLPPDLKPKSSKNGKGNR